MAHIVTRTEYANSLKRCAAGGLGRGLMQNPSWIHFYCRRELKCFSLALAFYHL
jgi:hypothetical protein